MNPVSARKWSFRKALPLLTNNRTDLAQTLGVDPLIAQLLLLRGVDSAEKAREFLSARLSSLPDPSLLPDMDIACQRVYQALLNSERISIHGDYDVDGITGCTLLVEVLRALGADVEYHIPLRMKDGYGLSAAALQRSAEGGCKLAISVDCGVSALVEAELAKELGIDLIITDHHQPPEVLPHCLALINPHLPRNRFPWTELSGVGVAFFLLVGLRRCLRDHDYFDNRSEPDLRHSLDLVALGTIADIVPLGGVNRILVRTGLELLENSNRPGISALKKVADVKKVTSGTVGFRLAPRLNAAGRLEDATLGVQLLLGTEGEDTTALAGMLDEFNHDRQKIEQQTLDQALAMLETEEDDRYTIVLACEDWHSGVIGIVASRLVERYNRPTVLIALENGKPGKGSARSISGFHLFNAFSACADHFCGFGGHAMAAGLSIEVDNISAFRDQFEQEARKQLGQDDLIPVSHHDGEIYLDQLSLPLLNQIDQINPFGMGNPQPAFVSRGCHVYNPRILVEKHLKFEVEQSGKRLDCIAFGQAEQFDRLNGSIDILYRPGINEWRGNKTLQLQIVDFVETE
jgi:single-stranded-DNA-specific exonuclease